MTSEFITALRGKQEEQQRRGGGSRASLLSPATVYLLIGALLLGAVITMSPALVHRRECRRRCRCHPAAALLLSRHVLVPVAAAMRFYSVHRPASWDAAGDDFQAITKLLPCVGDPAAAAEHPAAAAVLPPATMQQAPPVPQPPPLVRGWCCPSQALLLLQACPPCC